jgi:hypothetical protein
MKTKAKHDVQDEEKIGLGVDEQPAEETVNDSLGTIDAADTTDTDPDDDPELGDKGSGSKVDGA